MAHASRLSKDVRAESFLQELAPLYPSPSPSRYDDPIMRRICVDCFTGLLVADQIRYGSERLQAPALVALSVADTTARADGGGSRLSSYIGRILSCGFAHEHNFGALHFLLHPPSRTSVASLSYYDRTLPFFSAPPLAILLYYQDSDFAELGCALLRKVTAVLYPSFSPADFAYYELYLFLLVKLLQLKKTQVARPCPVPNSFVYDACNAYRDSKKALHAKLKKELDSFLQYGFCEYDSGGQTLSQYFWSSTQAFVFSQSFQQCVCDGGSLCGPLAGIFYGLEAGDFHGAKKLEWIGKRVDELVQISSSGRVNDMIAQRWAIENKVVDPTVKESIKVKENSIALKRKNEDTFEMPSKKKGSNQAKKDESITENIDEEDNRGEEVSEEDEEKGSEDTDEAERRAKNKELFEKLYSDNVKQGTMHDFGQRRPRKGRSYSPSRRRGYSDTEFNTEIQKKSTHGKQTDSPSEIFSDFAEKYPGYTYTGLAIGIPFSISAFIAMYHYYLAPLQHPQAKK